ncbi:hypothetical protein FOCC_FOCC007962 [Frankliniella occidentalis]|nr:hypothetical protein FOCC_FOCC007962 [Frankliniella occidentalis]
MRDRPPPIAISRHGGHHQSGGGPVPRHHGRPRRSPSGGLAADGLAVPHPGHGRRVPAVGSHHRALNHGQQEALRAK